MDFRELRSRYAQILVGKNADKSITDRYDALTKEHIEIIGDKIYRAIEQKNPASINSVFKRLLDMSISFSQINSCYYKDEALSKLILNSLRNMQKVYSVNVEPCGNWWYWEIGIPLSLNGIFTLMHDYADRQMIEEYMLAERHYNDEIKLTGCNRVWESVIFTMRGVLLEDEAMIKAASEGIKEVMVITESGDGFYKDGSFIQHNNIPYNGGYGRSLLQELAPMLYLLKGTDYKVKDTSVIKKWIKNSYFPFLTNGRCMDMVRGREVSRYYEQCDFSGSRMVSAILLFCEIMEDCEDIKAEVKPHITEEFFKYASPFSAELAYKLLNDDSIVPIKHKTYFKAFNSMDRAVKHMDGCAIGLAMHSERIAAFESINDENIMGFHTADGMLYLYKDNEPESDFFWQTINPYRLPGTTVIKNSTLPANDTSNGAFVGGCGIGEYGVCAMELCPKDGKITANKAWFFFDKEIVCLGSAINSKEQVETIIENRLVADGSKFSIHGKAAENGYDIKGAYLDGKHDIGYYFPEEQRVNVLREERKGRWRNINIRDDGREHTGTYLTMWIEHGCGVRDGDYAYIILPKCTEDDFKNYNEQCSVQIIENSDSIQCVSKGSVTGIIFLKDKARSVAGVACDKRCIVMTDTHNDIMDFVITDPTQKEKKIAVELDCSAKRTVFCSERIKIVQLKPFVVLEINTDDANGEEIRLILEGVKNV